jgi:shikimate dehydrogenase
LAIIGDPVGQVRAPLVWNPLFVRHGINAVLVPLEIARQHFESGLRGLMQIRNLDGIIITAPYKMAAAGIIPSLGEAGRMVRAINALRRESDGGWHGDMFDGRGFIAAVRAEGFTVSGSRICLIGSGGVGSAIAVALCQEGAASLTLKDLDRQRVNDLMQRLKEVPVSTRLLAEHRQPMDYDLVINATPLGLKTADPLPFSLDDIPSSAMVVDVNLQPPKTRLLVEAEKRGHRIQNGVSMMERQIDLLAEFFRLPMSL